MRLLPPPPITSPVSPLPDSRSPLLSAPVSEPQPTRLDPRLWHLARARRNQRIVARRPRVKVLLRLVRRARPLHREVAGRDAADAGHGLLDGRVRDEVVPAHVRVVDVLELARDHDRGEVVEEEGRSTHLWVAVADEASNEQPIPVPLGEIVEKVGATLDADGPGGDKVRVRLSGWCACLASRTALAPTHSSTLLHVAQTRGLCGFGQTSASSFSRSPRACTTRPSVIHGPWRRAQSRARPSTSCAR
mmetsp:Transcript_21559/g.63711  ORF Transcript_21559/g.63711 Transcript_21559/m.63711 type:complete len:247 (-) Transcript_21559:18-758(-)